jgi:ferredoxin, 2Fe-2S
MMGDKIQFTLVEDEHQQLIETYSGEYRNLMMLLKDKLFREGFGECGGMGRCATCIIKTTGIKGRSALKERNEPATLSKLGYEDENIRLSCQLLITTDLENAEIAILDLI